MGKQQPAYEGSSFTLASPEGGQDKAFGASRCTVYASRLADGALLIVALIWGSTFVMVKDAVTTYPVFSFLALRFAFAALVLLPVVVWRRLRSPAERPGPESERPPSVIPWTVLDETAQDRRSGSVPSASPRTQVSEVSRPVQHGDPPPEVRRRGRWLAHLFSPSSPTARLGQGRWSGPGSGRMTAVLVAPLTMGAALFAGYALQTFGLRLTTPAKAGFITGLSVVIVPVVSTLVLRQRPGRGAWLGVALATAGLALLSLQADLSVNPGDVLVLGCALAFACQILLTGRFASRYDPLLLTTGQIVVVALLSGIMAWLLESPTAPPGTVVFAAAFTGILATSLAFGVQTTAQRFTSPTRTALVFATEPVFAALFSYLLIGEVLGPRQLAGCALILAGMVVAEAMRNGRTHGVASGGERSGRR